MKLKLFRIEAASRSHSPFRLLSPFFDGQLRLHAGTLEEIRRASANPNGLIARHGLARVVAFYREQILPALGRLPGGESWAARYEVSWQLLQMLQAAYEHRQVLDLALSLIADLPRARFAESRREETEARDEFRRVLAAPLAQTAVQLKQNGMTAEAIRAFEGLQRIGQLERADASGDNLSDYAELLWDARDTRASTLPLYIRYLARHGWRTNGHGRLKEVAEYVRRRLAIDEGTPRKELTERVWLNQLAVCAAGPAEVARNVGLGYLLLGQPERALGYLRRAQPRDGAQDAATFFHLGRALYLTGGRAEANGAFESAAVAGFSRARIGGWLGLALARDGLRDESSELFRATEGHLSSEPGDDFYLQWGRACFLSGELDEAERRFRQAVERGGGGWRAVLGLSACLERGGKRDAATESLRRLLADAAEAAPPAYLLGRLLQTEGRLPDAAECYGRAVRLCPHDAEYNCSLGLMLDDLGEASALPHLERAAEAGAGGPEVVRRVMLKHARDGSRGSYRYWLARLASLCPDSEAVRRLHARSLASRATEAFNAEKFGEASQLWGQVERVLGEEPSVGERLAYALLYDAAARLKGPHDGEAWTLVEKAYELVQLPETEFLYAAGRMAQGDFGEACRRLTALAREQPERAELQSLGDLAARLFIEDESLAACVRAPAEADDSLRALVEGMHSALYERVKEALPPLAPARLPDDLALQPPPPPFEPAFELLEQTVLRDS